MQGLQSTAEMAAQLLLPWQHHAGELPMLGWRESHRTNMLFVEATSEIAPGARRWAGNVCHPLSHLLFTFLQISIRNAASEIVPGMFSLRA